MTNAIAEFLDITPSAFSENTFLIDSSKTKQGAFYQGKKIYPPSVIEDEQIDTVFISVTTSIATEIIDELRNRHPSVKHILFLGDIISKSFEDIIK